jgi:hypothetical protein
MSNPRSSYTLASASRFRPAFDKAIETGTHVEIPCKGTGLTMMTMRQRMSDGLLYLANELPDDFRHLIDSCPDCARLGKWCGSGERYTSSDYLKLKAQIKMRCNEHNDSVL